MRKSWLTVLMLLALCGTARAQGSPMPWPVMQFFDNNGAPLAGGLLYTCTQGGSCPGTTQTAYHDPALTTPWSNPIVLDSSGRAPVYLGQATYKFVLQTSAGVTIWTQDNVIALPVSTSTVDIQGTAGENISTNQVVYQSDGSGGKTPGLWYKADNTNAYSSVTNDVGIALVSIGTGTAGTIRRSGVVTGLSSLVTGGAYYVGTSGTLTSTAPTTNSRYVGQADSSTTKLVMGPDPALLNATLTTPRITGGTFTSPTINTPTITSPTITGTVAGGASYTAPTITSPSITGTVAGAATYTSPTLGGTPVIGGSVLNVTTGSMLAGCGFRLTLQTGVPAAENTVGATTIYISPYGSYGWPAGSCAFFDGSSTWAMFYSAEVSLPLGTLVSGKAYDVFCFNNSGAMNCEIGPVWTNDTTRATGLTTQNGVLVKSGNTTRRYMGTFYTTSTTTTEDSFTKRLVWNYYNRLLRRIEAYDATATWTYTTATWRQSDGNPANQVEFIAGWAEDDIFCTAVSTSLNDTISMVRNVGIGVDSTTVPAQARATGSMSSPSNVASSGTAYWNEQPFGHHVYTWLEFSNAAGGTTTWYGSSTSGGGIGSNGDGIVAIWKN